MYYNIKTEQLVVHRKTLIGADTFATVLTGLAGYATYEVRMSAYTKTGEGKKTDPEEFTTPDGSKFVYLHILTLFNGYVFLVCLTKSFIKVFVRRTRMISEPMLGHDPLSVLNL